MPELCERVLLENVWTHLEDLLQSFTPDHESSYFHFINLLPRVYFPVRGSLDCRHYYDEHREASTPLQQPSLFRPIPSIGSSSITCRPSII